MENCAVVKWEKQYNWWVSYSQEVTKNWALLYWILLIQCRGRREISISKKWIPLIMDAMAKIIHTEMDVTYTLISVALQDNKTSKLSRRNESYFLLKLNENSTHGIKLKDGISFMFAGPCLTQCQFWRSIFKGLGLYG